INSGVAVDINVAGAGVHTVNRNFGALGDPNFAGLFYALCVVIALVLKGIPKLLRAAFVAIFAVLILQTASLSAIITLITLSSFAIILRYRGKSVPILMFGFVGVVAVVSILLAIPQFRQIEAIQGLIIRISEKLSYIPRGRWDLLTTDRWDIWTRAMDIFAAKPLWSQLIGGSVITVMVTEPGINFACHNSYIQSMLNFGILGALMIYLPLFGAFGYRLINHFTTAGGTDTEDIRMIQLVIMFAFIFFGLTVDFFIDWTYMIFYFI
ncbi:MAG: O-antigen ligase family protein, partial [Clostridia bacterium]|nr:O-antigen ligase family protein [Clostridia bacterium]